SAETAFMKRGKEALEMLSCLAACSSVVRGAALALIFSAGSPDFVLVQTSRKIAPSVLTI
ncbi:hypothetical protein, partial [Klebsiella pneumoniae]|uniref:hypothetical protein n=1 Tax=Klebsiella pneumoniae TaxID=573 RepID=UPI002730789A